VCKKLLKQCETPGDFIRYSCHKGGKIIKSKKGVKIQGTKPGYVELHSFHNRRLANGTRAALIKGLIAIGLGGMMIGIWISHFIGVI
jgi:hypothetical protein